MSRKSRTVEQLAREANSDIDEVLVTLWDLGIDHVLNPCDVVKHSDLRGVRRALGIAARAQLRDPEYWSALFAVGTEEIRSILDRFGTPMGAGARRLPRGAVKRLKAEARHRGIDPLTGAISKGLALDPGSNHIDSVESNRPKLSVSGRTEWHCPGRKRELRWLTAKEVESIHFALVEDFAKSDDPIDPPGIRSRHLLESAVFRPQTASGSILKYSTIEASAAALIHALVLDHPHHNGNKRTALVSMLVFLDENGLTPVCDENDLFRLVLRVAQHKVVTSRGTADSDEEVIAITNWLCARTRVVDKGYRPLPWRRLAAILRAYDCRLEFPGGVGNRINVIRTKKKRTGLFQRSRISTLQTQVFYRDEGSEAAKSTIRKIRNDLHLDEIHGVDSFDFYSKEPSQVCDFIAKYRKTLYRLAKL